MLNKLASFIRTYDMISPGDEIVCAVSGGADSIALLFGMKLLTDVWDFRLSAAHFNHHLRGEESDRDEAFVREFCRSYGIALYVSGGQVTPSEKGLEAAARDARYTFLNSLPGKIATAHTADDNAETILMHLIRGTGLKGLGGITPKTDKLIRPMLSITRREVEDFLTEYALPHMEDSSNESDAFLRNRIRHRVMPLLKAENPRFSENMTAMAEILRLDEQALSSSLASELPDVTALRQMESAVRRRYLERFLKQRGVKEPEQSHISAVESLVFSENPSARVDLPKSVTIARQYGQLVKLEEEKEISPLPLPKVGCVRLGSNLTLKVSPAREICNSPDCFTVTCHGQPMVRSRMAGDEIHLPGGTRSLKKLFIDRKIPASSRCSIPVIADELGVLGVYGIGADDRYLGTGESALCIRFIKSE